MICTPCGKEVPDGAQAIFGVKRDGEFVFGWTCCHKPVGEADVILGSSDCLEKWLSQNPQHLDEIVKVFENHEHSGEFV